MRLEGRTAVVTGAGSGMGRAIALLFATEGARVVASDINEKTVNDVVSDIEKNGGKATSVIANVAKEEDVHNMINTAVNTYGSLDILVNNAGIMDNFVPVDDVTDELWERVLAVNLTGPMRATRKALPIMIDAGKGVIVNIASSASLQGSRAGVSYTASKHGVVGLTKNVAFQFADQGIRCNAICPGGVDTNVMQNATPHKRGMEKAMSGADSNPRSGSPEEVAHIALFLASDESSFVNGVALPADAGWLAY